MQIASNVFTKFVHFNWNISTEHTTETLQTAQFMKVSIQPADTRRSCFSSVPQRKKHSISLILIRCTQPSFQLLRRQVIFDLEINRSH